MSEPNQQKQNCSQYNDALVQRGEILLSAENLKDWQQELLQMNEGKKVHPFNYPRNLIFFGTLRVVFHSPYRWMTETFFPSFKRTYGEVAQAKRWERMVQETRLKA